MKAFLWTMAAFWLLSMLAFICDNKKRTDAFGAALAAVFAVWAGYLIAVGG